MKRRILSSLAIGALVGACAGYATTPQQADPRFACLDGLSVARVQHLMEWTAQVMRVSAEVPTPWFECADAATMTALYEIAGVQAEKRLGVYVSSLMAIVIADSRQYPEGNEHIIVHELAHHLQVMNGLSDAMTADELEAEAEAVHTMWMNTR